MVAWTEEGMVFDCAGETLVGVLALPDEPTVTGMVIIVGGPQYRAGSHRQFVQLARAAAAEGFATLRFDYRGMGDSSGGPATFDQVDADIAAAISALMHRIPAVKKVVLWGLCDGASAALLYARRVRDSRVGGLCILNPWVRTEAGLAKAQVKHYYGRRLLQPSFWAKLARGGVALSAIRDAAGRLRLASRRRTQTDEHSYQAQMALGVEAVEGEILLILSGQDLTAREFEEHARSNAPWPEMLARPNVTRVDLPEADHTFSSFRDSQRVARETLAWLQRSSVESTRTNPGEVPA